MIDDQIITDGEDNGDSDKGDEEEEKKDGDSEDSSM